MVFGPERCLLPCSSYSLDDKQSEPEPSSEHSEASSSSLLTFLFLFGCDAAWPESEELRFKVCIRARNSEGETPPGPGGFLWPGPGSEFWRRAGWRRVVPSSEL